MHAIDSAAEERTDDGPLEVNVVTTTDIEDAGIASDAVANNEETAAEVEVSETTTTKVDVGAGAETKDTTDNIPLREHMLARSIEANETVKKKLEEEVVDNPYSSNPRYIHHTPLTAKKMTNADMSYNQVDAFAGISIYGGVKASHRGWIPPGGSSDDQSQHGKRNTRRQ